MNNIPSETSVDSKEQPDSVSDSNISVTIEDGVWVFRKRQESAEEVIFYNTDYFKRIGFPDAEVSIGKFSRLRPDGSSSPLRLENPLTPDAKREELSAVTPDGKMKGGYYKHPEKLTYPFRQFVYLFQREKEKPVKQETSSEEVSEPSEHNPNFFERLGNYGIQISKGVQSGIDSVSPYFKTTPANLTDEEKQKLQEEEKQKQALLDEEEENEKKKAEEDSKNSDFDHENYWIVRIPIVNDDSLVPKNNYEKKDEELKSELLESKVEKELGKSKVVRVYEVGSRIIRMCESVKEYEELKIEASPLPGSRMSKWHRFTSPE